MERAKAFGILSKELNESRKTAKLKGEKIRVRGYKSALETLVSEAVLLTTGQKTGFEIELVKPSLAYVVFDPETLEKKYEIDPDFVEDVEFEISSAQKKGLLAIPYFYSG